jgi:hypothetical protein
MRKRVLMPALGAAALLAGCESAGLNGPGPVSAYAPPPPPPPSYGPPAVGGGFDPNEFAWSSAVGSNAVIGRVLYHAGDGSTWSCTGQTVALIPRTRYSAGRMRALYGSDERAVAPVAAVKARDAATPGVDYGRFVRTAVCDTRNGFVFSHLPDGAFFVIARAKPHRGSAAADDGVVVMQRVEVRDGAGLHVTLPVGG